MKKAAIKNILAQTESLLVNSDSARLDAEILLAHTLEKPRSHLHAWPEYELNQTQQKEFNRLITKRINGEPIAYITSTQEFWSQPFKVTPDTLIPRPETEILVETALNIGSNTKTQKSIKIIDLGTGSGCIAISIAKEKPNWEVTASDISDHTLDIAKHNADNLKTTNVRFIQSNWLDNIPTQKFDIIISNPPYIAEGDPHLDAGDLRFEPNIALACGTDGLSAIRTICEQAKSYLTENGCLLMEIGYDQANAVKALLQSNGYIDITFIQDLAGHNRVCQARLN